jgi:hypothetical protein
LDLWQLGTVLVMVSVRVTALNAYGFHCRLDFVGNSNWACSNGPSG